MIALLLLLLPQVLSDGSSIIEVCYMSDNCEGFNKGESKYRTILNENGLHDFLNNQPDHVQYLRLLLQSESKIVFEKDYDKNNIDSVIYEQFANLESGNYVITYNEASISLNDSVYIQKLLSDDFYIYLHGSESDNQGTIYINRTNNIKYSNINLILVDFPKNVLINMECDQEEADKPFTYNITTVNGVKVTPTLNTCNSGTIIINKFIIPNPDDSSSPNTESTEPENPPIESNNDHSETNDDHIESNIPPIESSNDHAETTNDDHIESNIPPIESSNDHAETTNDHVESDDAEKPFPTSIPRETPSPSRTPLPTRTVIPEIPMENHTIYSEAINMTTEGFINTTNTNETVQVTPDSYFKVLFNQTSITIYENSGFNSSSTPLYFSAINGDSTVIIDKDVNHSNIGITSDNSPKVQVSKPVNPLSFFHDNSKGGSVSIHDEGENYSYLELNEVNNRNGDFKLIVGESVESVSLSSILMTYISSFSISKEESSRARLLENDFGDVKIHVRDLIDITSHANATLDNVELGGKLRIRDDSSLVISNNASFLNDSCIELLIDNNYNANESLEKGPIIKFEGPLESLPSSVVLSSDGAPINVENLQVFQTKDTEKCSLFEDIFGYEEGRSGTIEVSCDNETGEVLLSAVQDVKKKGKKLSTGAIAGLIVAAVAVLVVIIILIVYFVKKKNKKDKTVTKRARGSTLEDDSDSVGL
ncbi:hypothetical protein M9Y10_020780 [Tritrichomonas musculus]|uniref:Uncharacterized protein n=1 Tax=Tritrichomonas musculus TaxID=1915356 RepID=A0ABR2HEK1_9EUKA